MRRHYTCICVPISYSHDNFYIFDWDNTATFTPLDVYVLIVQRGQKILVPVLTNDFSQNHSRGRRNKVTCFSVPDRQPYKC